MTWSYPLGLFQGHGIELEYMIVDAETLDVLPIADRLLERVGAVGGDAAPEGSAGRIGWSNELALHLLEFKSLEPEPQLEPLAAHFQRHVRRANAELAPLGGRLLPGGMHPWMNPEREMRLWPHDNAEIYAAFDRIFSCRGHGWANLQSAHLNLSFANDEEFGRLHAAVRLILPALPALAASSPLQEGHLTGCADTRLETYRHNARRLPIVSGRIIPEPVFTRAEYEGELLGSIYRAVAPLDPDGLLQEEWLNARGAIARFDRGAIEIRVLDVQEHPLADLAICALTTAAVRALAEGRWMPSARQRDFAVEPLAAAFLATVAQAEEAVFSDASWLRAFGLPPIPLRAADFWQRMEEELLPAASPFLPSLQVLQRHGSLSTRLRRACGKAPAPERLRDIYQSMAICLQQGTPFLDA